VRRNRQVFLFAAGSGMAAVVLAVVLVVVFAGGSARRPHLIARSSSGATSTSAAASTESSGRTGTSGTSGATGAAVSIPVEDARAVVVRYLDDINTQNRSDAAALICRRLVDDWRKKIDQSGGDFTLAVTRAVFRGASPAPTGIALSYDLDVRPRTSDQVNTNTVTFTVIGSPGAYQLCGEN
jgi:hypothetical protein